MINIILLAIAGVLAFQYGRNNRELKSLELFDDSFTYQYKERIKKHQIGILIGFVACFILFMR